MCQFCGESNKADLNKFCGKESVAFLRGKLSNLINELFKKINHLPNEEERREIENELNKLKIHFSD